MNIRLWTDVPLETDGANDGCPSMTPYLLDGPGPFSVVIVFPGGGYMGRAEHEAEPFARWFNQMGIASFVLNYRVFPFQYPTQLNDALRAIRTVRHQAAEWNLDPERIGIIGFSAGGHLAATTATHYDYGDSQAEDLIERYSSRPDLLALCYPVITMGPFTHQGSRLALLGDRQDDSELAHLLSNETQVTAETPPTFIWHGVDDQAVPVENSLLFAESLRRHQVPFALHLFTSAPHGLGLAQGFPEVQTWPDLFRAWLEQRWSLA